MPDAVALELLRALFLLKIYAHSSRRIVVAVHRMRQPRRPPAAGVCRLVPSATVREPAVGSMRSGVTLPDGNGIVSAGHG